MRHDKSDYAPAAHCRSVLDEQGGSLKMEAVSLQELAERLQTPLFVYSRQAIETAYTSFVQALHDVEHSICYAVKANGALAILQVLARMGAGFDIVSVGELERVLAAGGAAGQVTFSGVGKRTDEMERALAVGVGCFNVESEQELQRLNAVASRLDKQAPIALRLNPDIAGHTHPHLTTGRRDDKFGVPLEQASVLYRRAASLPNLHIVGAACHIGSSLHDPAPYLAAGERLIAFADRLACEGIALEHLDFGGGFPIAYQDEKLPPLTAFLDSIKAATAERGLKVIVEPGRAIVGPAGVLLTRIDYIKPGDAASWVVVDAGMSELIRPPLYDAWHTIRAVTPRLDRQPELCHVVGPVCESADFLGRDRELRVAAGEILAIMDTGAYGAVMASNYNARPRPAEVLVNGGRAVVIRRRETPADLMRLETLAEDEPDRE